MAYAADVVHGNNEIAGKIINWLLAGKQINAPA
jgi:hypothetical protein